MMFFPVEGQGPPVRKKLLILDLSGIQLAEVNEKLPNLMRLVSGASTGIVNLAKCPFDGSLFLYLQKQRWASSSANTIVFQRSIPTAIRRFPSDLWDRDIQVSHTGLRRRDLLRHVNSMVGRILQETDFRSTLVIGCFSRHRLPPERKDTVLAAVVLKGMGFGRGILYSPSTRKPGIITFYDLKTMVRQFNDPETRPVFRIGWRPGHWRSISATQRELIQNFRVRQPALTIYGYLMLGCLAALVIGVFFRSRFYPMKAFLWIYLFLLAVPGAFLLMAVINPLDWPSILIYSLGISGILLGLAILGGGKKPGHALLRLSFITVGLVLINGLFNGFCEYKSLLGYSVVSGGRYHGIGNEYMGILLGAYITGVSLSLKKTTHWRTRILWSAAFLMGMILIHPSLGADVGGGISAIIGLGITNLLWLGRPVRWRELLLLGASTGLALAIAAFWDLVLNRANMSHWGQLLLAIQTSGWEAFQTIIIRKLLMNLRLTTETPLSFILILTLLTIPVLYFHPPEFIKGLISRYPKVMAGFAGLSITAWVGFLVNDSGIASAALIFMFGTGMMALMIDDATACKKRSGKRPV